MNPVTVIFLTPKRRSSHQRLAVNQEKSRLTTMEEGFAFLGPEFRKTPVRWSYMWAAEAIVCLLLSSPILDMSSSYFLAF
jgi:hypothetical protein